MPRGVYKRKRGIYPCLPQTKEHKRKLGKVRKKLWQNPEFNKKIRKAKKGKHYPKISIALKGNTHTLGKKHTKEAKRKISESKRGKPAPHCTGKRNHFWKGGISYEPYSTDWTETLKRSIRERDKYTCQLCGKEPAIYCHHIDYDKKNCSSDNLITLCHSCHGKTNFNRKYWTKLLKSLIKELKQ